MIICLHGRFPDLTGTLSRQGRYLIDVCMSLCYLASCLAPHQNSHWVGEGDLVLLLLFMGVICFDGIKGSQSHFNFLVLVWWFSTKDNFATPTPQGTFDRIWRYFWLSLLEMVLLVSRGQKPAMRVNILQCTSQPCNKNYPKCR